MQRKRLEDMNLLDDFLFNAVMTFPGIGERFCFARAPVRPVNVSRIVRPMN